MSQSKNLLFQEIRGICIIAVICIHLPPSLEGTSSFDYWLSFRKIVEFPVAIFVFLSGYFLNINKEKSIFYFYKKRFLRLAIPYFIWTVLYSILILRNNIDLSASGMFNIIFLGGASGHLYFISVLLQLIIISPIIIYAFENKNKILQIALLAITPLSLLLLYISNIYYGYAVGAPYRISLVWILFYILGIAYRKQYFTFKISHTLTFLLVITTLIIAIAETHILIYLGCSPGFASSQITIGSFLFTIAVIALLLNKEEEKPNNLLVKFGDYSFGIYFIHVFFLFVMYKILPVSTELPYFILIQISYFMVSFTLSYLCVLLASKYLNSKILRYIGFN